MKKGFTLIELLIVIAILAILTAAVVIVLNPAQMIAESRDAQRFSDLQSVNSAIALYLTTASTSVSMGSQNRVMNAIATATCPFTANGGTCTYNATTTVDGNGWIGIDFRNTSGGSPLASLPTDPTNSATYTYYYAPDVNNIGYEIDARLESNKFRVRMLNDGGNKNDCGTDWGVSATAATCFFETGIAPGLAL